MTCNFRIVYGLRTAYSICTDRTDRHDLSDPLDTGKSKIYSSPINDMQFSDRVQFVTGQFHPYGPYSASTFRRTVQIETGNFQTVSDCVYWTTLSKSPYWPFLSACGCAPLSWFIHRTKPLNYLQQLRQCITYS